MNRFLSVASAFFLSLGLGNVFAQDSHVPGYQGIGMQPQAPYRLAIQGFTGNNAIILKPAGTYGEVTTVIGQGISISSPGGSLDITQSGVSGGNTSGGSFSMGYLGFKYGGSGSYTTLSSTLSLSGSGGSIKTNLGLSLNLSNSNIKAVSDVSPENFTQYKNNILVTKISSNGTTYFNGGNVGIGTGTATPTAQLEVNGTIKANAIKIKNWTIEAPDFVFEDNYKLKSLSEVESYIEKNNHLPEVPSASAMKRDGVDLSELNMTLLKKVEELTLYVIEQNKKLENLEKKVASQK